MEIKFRFYLLFFFFNTVFSFVHAQDIITVNGKVVQLDNNESIPFANVGLLNSLDSLVQMGTTNFEGEFSFQNIKSGNYKLKISCIGFESIQKDAIVIKNGVSIDLGYLVLKEALTKLDEVNVVAEKAMIQQGVGKTILNVGQQIANSGEAATDLIQYLPSASTDEDNGVLVRGNPATILIDGVSSDLSNPLESLPASSIEKIELITNPSAKYSSQSGAAIINIILKKGKQKGANGRVSFAWGTPKKYQTSGNLILKNNKWTSFTTANYLKYEDEINSRSERIKHTETGNSVLYNNAISDRLINSLNVSQGIAYQLNKRSSLRFDGSYKKVISENDSYQESENIKGDTLRVSYNKNETDSESDKQYYKASLTYQKEIDALSNITAIAQYELQDNYSPYEKETHYFDPITEEQKSNYIIQTRSNPEQIESKRLKVDLEKGINKNYKVESGLLFIDRTSDVESDLLKTKYTYVSKDDTYRETLDSSRMYQFVVNEILPSTYAVLSYERNKWAYSIGLRYEFAHLESGTEHNDSLSQNTYHNFLPSVLLQKKVGKKTTLGFSGTKRTKMPNYRQLNPVEVYSGNYSKTTGNPDLLPQKITNLEFNLNQKTSGGVITSSFFYKKFDDMIARTQSYVQEEEYEVLNRSYDNIGEVDQIGMDVNVSHRLFNTLRLKLNVVCMDQKVKSESNGIPVSLEDFSYTTKFIANQTFKNGFRYQLTSIYNSANKTVSGENLEYYYTNVSVGKSILKKKGNITCSFYDIFDTQSRDRIDTSSVNYIQYNFSKNKSQKVLLAFNYRFNTEKK